MEEKVEHLIKFVKDYVAEDVVIENAGNDGQFFLLMKTTEACIAQFEKEILSLAREEGYHNAYFCPEPDAHIEYIKNKLGLDWSEDELFVLNCFT